MPLIRTSAERHVLTVELCRAAEGNALNRDMQHELASCWEQFETNEKLWVAVLHGEGGVFSIGHDVEELRQGEDEKGSRVLDPRLFPLHLGKPVIAAVEGPCYGLGFELALSCDLRIAEQGALFGFPDQNLHMSYRVASVLLPRMTSTGVALELLMSAKTVGSERMEELKLVNLVTPGGGALARAKEEATSMVERFGSVGAFQKRRILQLSGMSIPAAMGMERGSTGGQ